MDSSEIGQNIQNDIDLQVTGTRLNESGISNLLYYLYKNVSRKQVSYEISVSNISKFDGQNSIIGGLLAEIKSGKPTDDDLKKFLNSAPDTKDLKTQKNLEKLKKSNKNLSLKNANANVSSQIFPNLDLPELPNLPDVPDDNDGSENDSCQVPILPC